MNENVNQSNENNSNVEKQYLVLLETRGETEAEKTRDWMICFSRQETYDYIKEELLAMIEEGIEVDIDDMSKVIVSGANDFYTAATVREFMQYMRDSGKVKDDTSFDIEEF